MTMPMAMAVSTEEVVTALQEQEDDDATKGSEAVEGMQEGRVATSGCFHADGLGLEWIIMFDI